MAFKTATIFLECNTYKGITKFCMIFDPTSHIYDSYLKSVEISFSFSLLL